MPLLPARRKEIILYFLECRTGPTFSAHRSAQDIAIRSGYASIVERDTDHVLLIHHDPVGFAQLLFKYGMKIFKLVRVIMPKNIFAHHPRLGYTWPDNGRGSDQYLIIITFQSTKQTAHGRTFDIKTTNCSTLT
ncbi:hypothetical protein D3C72_1974130 [compost metagenome]